MNDETDRGPERLRGLSTDENAADSLRMQVSIFGGLASERVQLDAEVLGTGQVSGRLENALTDHAGSFEGRLPTRELSGLLELLASDEFIGQPREPMLFPPDTIVGSVEITLAGDTVGTYLAAVDDDQVAGTAAAGSPTSTLLGSVLEVAESMIGGGDGPQPTAAT